MNILHSFSSQVWTLTNQQNSKLNSFTTLILDCLFKKKKLSWKAGLLFFVWGFWLVFKSPYTDDHTNSFDFSKNATNHCPQTRQYIGDFISPNIKGIESKITLFGIKIHRKEYKLINLFLSPLPLCPSLNILYYSLNKILREKRSSSSQVDNFNYIDIILVY